ncbi:hypothetical protein B0H12DRAFT_1222554 [Mycena haematopus]|nr:hypothetical protein B0H12DRAFT_1222554 [Mycena haematopus]
MAPGNHGISGQTGPIIGSAGAPIREIARGSVVLAPASVGILRRLNAAREERNRKRAEGREKGDTEVSEDEPDELAPLLTAVVSPQERSGPGNSGAPLQDTATPHAHSSSRLLFEDAVAEKNSFQAHDNSIPDAVFSLAKNGISPPLTLFLPRSLERVRSGNVKMVKHGTGETTKVTVIDVSEFPDEETLDQATFLTCYNTFLSFLEASAGARIFRGFTEHYNCILSDPDLSTWFAAYQYCDALQSAKNLLLLTSNSDQDEDSEPDSPSFGVVRSGREKPGRATPITVLQIVLAINSSLYLGDLHCIILSVILSELAAYSAPMVPAEALICITSVAHCGVFQEIE